MTTKLEQTKQPNEQILAVCRTFIQHYAPKDYIDDPHNANLLRNYILTEKGGFYSIPNLLEALDSSYYKARSHEKTSAMTAQEKAAKALQEKKDRIRAEGLKTVARWISDVCPRALLVSGDLFPADGDKIVAYLHGKYPEIASSDVSVTFEQLNEAVTVLWDSLAKFSTEPEDSLLRNQPAPPPRKLSEQAQIDAGIKPVRLKGHSTEDKPVSMQEELRQTAKKAKAIYDKQHGIPSEEEQFQTKAEAISVTNRLGRFDHGKTQQLRASFVYKDAGKTIVDWRRTWELRDRLATQIEKEKNR